MLALVLSVQNIYLKRGRMEISAYWHMLPVNAGGSGYYETSCFMSRYYYMVPIYVENRYMY